jgi:hypothetical protein
MICRNEVGIRGSLHRHVLSLNALKRFSFSLFLFLSLFLSLSLPGSCLFIEIGITSLAILIIFDALFITNFLNLLAPFSPLLSSSSSFSSLSPSLLSASFPLECRCCDVSDSLMETATSKEIRTEEKKNTISMPRKEKERTLRERGKGREKGREREKEREREMKMVEVNGKEERSHQKYREFGSRTLVYLLGCRLLLSFSLSFSLLSLFPSLSFSLFLSLSLSLSGSHSCEFVCLFFHSPFSLSVQIVCDVVVAFVSEWRTCSHLACGILSLISLHHFHTFHSFYQYLSGCSLPHFSLLRPC